MYLNVSTESMPRARPIRAGRGSRACDRQGDLRCPRRGGARGKRTGSRQRVSRHLSAVASVVAHVAFCAQAPLYGRRRADPRVPAGHRRRLRMPVDIFPEIDIPVVSVVWTYNGMSAEDIQNRILTLHERQLASLVDDISRIEATQLSGRRRREGLSARRRGCDAAPSRSWRAARWWCSSTCRRNITPPLVLRYGATDVPIIQLSLSSNSLPDTKLNDLGQNIIRPALAVVHGAEVPYPYGGKPRVIMADLDPQALQARGLVARRRQRSACSSRMSFCRPATSRSATRIMRCR